jgi:hypothetical protein
MAAKILYVFSLKNKDCSEQPDPKLRGGTTKQSAGSRPKNSYSINKVHKKIRNSRLLSRVADSNYNLKTIN